MGLALKIAVAVPLRASIPSLSFSGIMGCIAYTADWAARNGHDFHPITVDKAHTCIARNAIAKTAIDDGDEWVLWLDDDSFPPHDAFPRMLRVVEATGADSVAGLCYQRGGLFNSPSGTFDANAEFVYTAKSGFIDSTGFHFVLTPTSLLKAVSDVSNGKPFQQPFNPATGEVCGEDRFFWAVARKLGKTLYHDSTLESGHVCTTVITTETRTHLLSLTGRPDCHREDPPSDHV